MKTNDILRRLRYILDYSDAQMSAVFAEVDHKANGYQIRAWLRKDTEPEFEECSDTDLAHFLNGLINLRRGRRDDQARVVEEKMNNNLVFMKLKIAFNLQAEDILDLLAKGDINISKHELSAFFRRSNHKHYRECKDQVLRNFLAELQKQHRGA